MPVALAIVEGHELSETGLLESVERLTARGIPAWAAEFRFLLLSWGSDRVEIWYPKFALRSETALTGLQIVAPNDTALIYQRVFLHFVGEALRPFVEYARGADAYRQNGYKALIELFEHCERSISPANIQVWPHGIATFP